MADKFVTIKCGRSREEQMLAYAELRRIRSAPPERKQEARALIADVGGREWGRALWEFLTTDVSYERIVQKYRIPEGKLKLMRREVYRRWQR